MACCATRLPLAFPSYCHSATESSCFWQWDLCQRYWWGPPTNSRAAGPAAASGSGVAAQAQLGVAWGLIGWPVPEQKAGPNPFAPG